MLQYLGLYIDNRLTYFNRLTWNYKKRIDVLNYYFLDYLTADSNHKMDTNTAIKNLTGNLEYTITTYPTLPFLHIAPSPSEPTPS